MATYKLATNYFYGNKASDYAIENGFLDYATFAKSFDAVLNNDIISNTSDIGYWDIVNGSDYDEETESYTDIFQYFIVSDLGARIIQDMTDEILFYNETLDMYVWGVTHCGTSWDYVLTDIKLNCGYDEIELQFLQGNKNTYGEPYAFIGTGINEKETCVESRTGGNICN